MTEEDLTTFLEWLENEKDVFLCRPGYAGESVPIGLYDDLVKEYIALLSVAGRE